MPSEYVDVPVSSDLLSLSFRPSSLSSVTPRLRDIPIFLLVLQDAIFGIEWISRAQARRRPGAADHAVACRLATESASSSRAILVKAAPPLSL